MNNLNHLNQPIETYLSQTCTENRGSIPLNRSTCDGLPRIWYGGGGGNYASSNHSSPSEPHNVIYPVHIARRGRTTVVWWNDSTKTHVTLEDGRTDGGVFAAFCIAYAKRCFGSTTFLSRIIDEADEQQKEARRKLRQEHRKKRMAIARKMEQDERNAAFQKLVRQYAEEMRAKREAHRLLEAEEKEGH